MVWMSLVSEKKGSHILVESEESWQEVAKQLFNYCELIFFEEMIS